MLKMQETLWKNNLICVNDLPMIHVHFIVIVTVVPEEKIEGITFVSNFLKWSPGFNSQPLCRVP
jgi:hypothetical protein